MKLATGQRPTIISAEQAGALPRARSLPVFDDGLLEQHRADAHWAIADDGLITARCSLWWRETPRYQQHRVGVIGHYGAASDEAAAVLLEFSAGELAAKGCTLVVGPMDGSTWRDYRLVADGSDEPRFFLEPANPPEWPVHFARAGFSECAGYFSAVVEDLSRSSPRVKRVRQRMEGSGVRIRVFDKDRFDDELQHIYDVARSSFVDHLMYAPLSEGEFRTQFEPLRAHVPTELILLAKRDQEAVGFCFAFPDLLQRERGEPLDTVIVKTLGVRPGRAFAGLGQLLLEEVQQRAAGIGYRRADSCACPGDGTSGADQRQVRGAISPVCTVCQGAWLMNVAEILRSHADAYPTEIALIDGHRGRSRSMTYQELERSAGRTANLFRQSGLNTGDAVLVFHPMSAELYVVLAAIFRAGLTAVFIDPSANRKLIEQCCSLLPPRGLVASSRAHLLRVLSPAIRRIPIRFSIGRNVPFAIPLERSADCRYDADIERTDTEGPALATLTSGSTGEPKAAIRTHGFLLAQHRALEESLSMSPGDRELSTLPIFVLANLASRVTSILADADLRRPAEICPERVVEQIRAHSPNRAAASPAFFERIVEYCKERAVQLPTLQRVFTGGGPVSLALLDGLHRVAPRAEITAVYGSTEAEPIGTVDLKDFDANVRSAVHEGRGLLAGRPVSSIRVRIIEDRWGSPVGPLMADEFDSLCVPAGAAGEIVVSGDHVLPGYLNGRGEEENKFLVGKTRWHRTGDAGYFDDRGRIWLLGRCAARVDDCHGVLYPLGVEQAALRHPRVGQAAMLGHRGRRVLAVTLVDANGCDDVDSLLESLSFAKVDSVRVVKRLPTDRRHNTKIDYAALRALLEP